MKTFVFGLLIFSLVVEAHAQSSPQDRAAQLKEQAQKAKQIRDEKVKEERQKKLAQEVREYLNCKKNCSTWTGGQFGGFNGGSQLGVSFAE